MIKIEFPAHRTDIALAIGAALTSIGTQDGDAVPPYKKEGPEFPVQSVIRDMVAGAAEEQEQTETPKSVGTVTEQVAASSSAPKVTNDASAKVDQKGVSFNAEFCGQAAEPFYQSGPRRGQWKKRKGVSDDVYDGWYTASTPEAEPAPETEVNAAGAFTPKTETAAPAMPKDGGGLIQWIAEMQQAECLTTADVEEAYAATGVQVHHLFSDDAPAAIEALTNVLSTKVRG